MENIFEKKKNVKLQIAINNCLKVEIYLESFIIFLPTDEHRTNKKKRCETQANKLDFMAGIFCFSTTATTTLKTKKGFEGKNYYEKFSLLNHSKITDKKFSKNNNKNQKQKNSTKIEKTYSSIKYFWSLKYGQQKRTIRKE